MGRRRVILILHQDRDPAVGGVVRIVFHAQELVGVAAHLRYLIDAHAVLLLIGGGLFNIYFARLPLTGFDACRGKLVPLTTPGWPKSSSCGSGQACPDPQDKNKNLPEKEKVSGMCPV
jgi:hypothetical protein